MQPEEDLKAIQKRRRHSMKAKSMSRPLLESVNESEDSSSNPKAAKRLLSKSQEGESTAASSSAQENSEDSSRCFQDYFGVKSYLHHFYEVRTVKNPHLYEEFPGSDDDFQYLFHSRERRWRSLWWRVTIWGSVNILVVGVIVILIGYLIPKREIVIGKQDELEVIDRSAIHFNRNLDLCKVVGLIVFCVGGTILAVTLLLPNFLRSFCCDPEGFNDGPLVPPSHSPPPQPKASGVGCWSSKSATKQKQRQRASSTSSSTTEQLVPATEEVTSIQPQWNDSEVIATKEGLCTLP